VVAQVLCRLVTANAIVDKLAVPTDPVRMPLLRGVASTATQIVERPPEDRPLSRGVTGPE
jgi:hypothetical protein